MKKIYPPGTFIPTPARICAIIQLCLAFSLLLWQASQPFMGDLFRAKSEMLFYQDVMGIESSQNLSEEKKARLERNKERFQNQPTAVQEAIKNNYAQLSRQLDVPFSTKIKKTLRLFTLDLSTFEVTWIFLSIIISIMLLKKIEGAQKAVWLLPLLAILFAIENITFRHAPSEQHPYPSEQYIVQHYLDGNGGDNIKDQHERLLKGWNLYLIQEWSHEIPSSNPEILQKQGEKGEFLFNLENLKHYKFKVYDHNAPISTVLLSLYIGWNLLFAYIIFKKIDKIRYNTL